MYPLRNFIKTDQNQHLNKKSSFSAVKSRLCERLADRGQNNQNAVVILDDAQRSTEVKQSHYKVENNEIAASVLKNTCFLSTSSRL